jgi:hypothetical protein
MSARALNLLVFREGHRSVWGRKLRDELAQQLAQLQNSSSQDDYLRALLRAGELECGVADARHTGAACERVTDGLADFLVGTKTRADLSELSRILQESFTPERMSISVPEGFAYYGLHPLTYSEAVGSMQGLGARVVVVGIRSIGTTLSAVAAAQVRKSGRRVRRLTVRPEGHPYNRRVILAADQSWVSRGGLEQDADYVVVDEGPGLSGSSFLSVAEALVRQGVARENITLLCGHEPIFANFCCEDGLRRAEQFRWIAVPHSDRKPAGADIDVGSGEWRRRLLGDEAKWPASWTNFERAKYLSTNDKEPRLFKFHGLGHFGDAARERETCVAESGFGPQPRQEAHGFVSYPWLNGRPMSRQDLNECVLERMADYCAFRQRSFGATVGNLDALQQMAGHNLDQFELDTAAKLRLERPVIADGCMQPHEWLLSAEGRMLKTDSGSHGDDHFFPGATDIAWDLAGAMVEWQMDGGQRAALVSRYERQSGDQVSTRIGDYMIAYAVFRRAYCSMAANALSGGSEWPRLERSADNYREMLLQCTAATPVGS